MVTRLGHIILIVIISNNTLLNLPIAFTYYFISINLFSQFIKSYSFIASIKWLIYKR